MTSAQPFLLRPENQKFLTGETQRLPGSTRPTLFLIPALLAVLALALFWAARRQWAQEESFRRNRVAAGGTIIDRRESSSPGVPDFENGIFTSDDDYLVTYRFEAVTPAGRRAVQREASLSKQDYGRWQVGAPVAVTYDPTNPSFSRMQGEGGPPQGLVLAVLGTVLLGASALIGLGVLVSWQRGRCLALAGAKLEGQLVRCTGKKHEDGGLILELEYRFLSPSGRVITGSASAFRGDLTELTLPAPQSRLVVLYHSESIYQVL
jgi:hypothetical protein